MQFDHRLVSLPRQCPSRRIGRTLLREHVMLAFYRVVSTPRSTPGFVVTIALFLISVGRMTVCAQSRVRPTFSRAQKALDIGLARSESLRLLVETIDRSDVIVHVVDGTCPVHGHVPAPRFSLRAAISATSASRSLNFFHRKRPSWCWRASAHCGNCRSPSRNESAALRRSLCSRGLADRNVPVRNSASY